MMTFLASFTLTLDVDTPWLVVAGVFFACGALVATARKSLAAFSRKSLQEKLPPEERERYTRYLDRVDDYEIALRVIDQGVRLLLIGCSVLPFLDFSAPSGVGLFASLASFLGLMLALIVVVLVGLELVPSILSRLSPEGLLIRVLPVVDAAYRVLAIPMRAYSALVALGARAIGSPPPREPADVMEEEILNVAEEGERDGLLEKSEKSVIEALFRFRDRAAVEVLTPRTEMVAIDVTTSIPECVRVALECGHSRLPVYRESKDAILGILYVKDLLKFWERRDDEPFRLEDVIRKANFVPESEKISALFQDFRTRRFHIAIVQDEFGGTSGLITIEDVIEEILGEIEEEFDPDIEDEKLLRVAEDVIEIDARYLIDELNSELRDELPAPIPESEDVDTIGGYLFHVAGRVPAAGDVIEVGSLQFEVIAADDRTIRRVRMRISRENAETAGRG